MAEDEEMVTARYIVSNVSTQLMLRLAQTNAVRTGRHYVGSGKCARTRKASGAR